MSLECALKILKEKKFIEISYRGPTGRYPRCPWYIISSKNRDLINRIHKKACENDEYICSEIAHEHNGERFYSYFSIVKTEKVDKWLEYNCKQEETKIIKCEDFIADYIFDYTHYYQSSDCGGYLIVNVKVKEERENKEKEEERKAIELFESML